MNKVIPIVCFMLFMPFFCEAKVTPLGSVTQLPQATQPNNQPPTIKKISEKEFEQMVVEGLAQAKEVDKEKLNINTSIIKNQKNNEKDEGNKSIFDKIYDKALERIDASSQQNQRGDVKTKKTNELSIQDQQKKWKQSNIPVIKAALPPDNTLTTIVALEHIPYLMNFIEILPDGMVRFEETVVVVANGEKLKKGLTKILPIKIYNDKKKAHRLDYTIIDVTINGNSQDYKIVSDNDYVYLQPKEDYNLDSGVYTYKFEYLVDNLLWKDKDEYKFFWDVAGNGWNLVIDRLGASLNMPLNAFGAYEVLLGTPVSLSKDAVDIYPNGETALAYVAKRPLFVGEGMYIIASVKADALMPESLWQKMIRFFYNWYDVILAFIGFIVAIVSFAVSWRYIRKDKGQIKVSLNKTATIIRYIAFNRFDMRSLCGFLLELYRKNIIDIQQTADTVLLIKRTDNLKSLDKSERKAIEALFPKHETIFHVSETNKLPFKRFAKILKKDLARKMFRFKFKLILGYILGGLGLILVTEALIALFGYRVKYEFFVMALATIVSIIGVGMFSVPGKWWLKGIIRLVALDVIFLGLILFSAVINPIAGILFILTFFILRKSMMKYLRTDGLIKHYIKDIDNFKNYLLQHRENILLGKDFQNYQAAVLALNLEGSFVDVNKTAPYNKLNIMKNIINLNL